MRIVICIQLILFLLNCNLKGQWSVKKYGVNDVRELTNEQLRESFREYKQLAIIAGGFCVGLGGISILVANTTYKNGLPEDATFGEELLGSYVMKSIYKILGIGLIGGGAIIGSRGLSRSHNIKSILNEHNKYNASINIEPIFISGDKSRLCTGLALSYRF